MSTSYANSRPDFVGPDWLRCTHGYSFVAAAPPQLRDDGYLASNNLWERLLCVTAQAQAGDFRNVEALIEVAMGGDSVHLRDCAVRIFAQAAPSALLPRLSEVLENHADPDIRLEICDVALLTADPRIGQALARHRARVAGFESECAMDAVSAILEPDIDARELVDSPLDDEAYVEKVDAFADALVKEHGEGTAMHHGAPLDLDAVARSISELCAEEDPSGGYIFDRLSLIEGMTGAAIAGCLDDDCAPQFAKISYVLNRLRQDKTLEGFEAGKRYFFGHALP
ncbi:MAG: hypothetical protein AAF799_17405 [Myxococcota bacterium]